MTEIGSTNVGTISLDSWTRKSVQNLRLTSLIVAIVLLVNVMAPASAHPAPKMITINHSHQKSGGRAYPLYVNFCRGIETSANESTIQDKLTKLDAYGALKIVNNSLTLTKSNFDHLNQTLIAMVYEPMLQVMDPNHTSEYQHLDNNISDDFEANEELSNKSQDSTEKNDFFIVQKFLIKFYKRLIVFAEKFEILSAMIPKTGPHVKEHRNVILSLLKNQLKNLLCVVDSNIVGKPSDHIPKRQIEKVRRNNWPHDPDFTRLQTIDMSVFVDYKEFLTFWTVESKSLLHNMKKTQMKKRKRKSSSARLNHKRNVRDKQLRRHHRRSSLPRKTL